MYLRIFLVSLALSLFGGSAFAKGGFVLWSGDAEHFHKVADLPDTAQYKFNDDYIDLGVLYKSVEIFFVPIWQYDKQYVGLIPNDPDSYYEIPESEVRRIAKAEGLTLPDASDVKLSFWTAWGGKLIVAAFFVFMIIGFMMPDDDEEEQSENA